RLDRYISTGDRHIPTVSFLGKCNGLGCAFNRSSPPNRKTPDFRKHQKAIVESCVLVKLRIGKTFEPIASVEARVAWSPAILETTKEGLIGTVYTQYHILQYLAMDFAVFGHGLLDT